MPTYEYVCRQCGEHLEVVQSFTDDALTECPNCSGELKKVFGNIGIVFKGSGFYKTDSRSSSKAGKSKSDASPATAEKSSADTGTTPKGDTSSGSASETPKKDASSNGSKTPSVAPSSGSGGSSGSSGKTAAAS